MVGDAPQNEQGNVASKLMNFDWEFGLRSNFCPLFPDLRKRQSKVLPTLRQKFAKFWKEKKGARAMRVLPLNSARIQLPGAKGR
jgi:hypothetical protein